MQQRIQRTDDGTISGNWRTGCVTRNWSDLPQTGGDEAIIATRRRCPDGDVESWAGYDPQIRSTISNIVVARPDGVFRMAWSKTTRLAKTEPASDAQISLAGALCLLRELRKKSPLPVVRVSPTGTVCGINETLPITDGKPLKPVSISEITNIIAGDYAPTVSMRTKLATAIVRLVNACGAQIYGIGSGEHFSYQAFIRKIIKDYFINPKRSDTAEDISI